jgi:twitching motility protein PilT
MPGIDQILSVVVKQGANELRLGTNREPSVYARGARVRFTMAPTSNAVLRQLLGEILSLDRDRDLAEKRSITFEYQLAKVGEFHVTMSLREPDEFEVKFVHVSNQSRPNPAIGSSVGNPKLPNPTTASSAAPAGERPQATVDVGCTPMLLELTELARHTHASDLHLADGQLPYLRVDGELRALTQYVGVAVREVFELDESRLKLLEAGSALERVIELPSRSRLRVSIYRAEGGFAAAVRLLPGQAPELDELDLPLPLHVLAEEPHGLVLICGATGSGKSTTLAALCRYALEHRSALLVTLEDPIEFSLAASSRSLVRQRQVGRDVTDFHSGLRDALRADPDVIMVGELRDAETIRLALTAAETGHLVLASLHSGSASACIERVIDAYPSEQRPQIRVQLADALRAVVVQKLVRRAQGSGRLVALEALRVNRATANIIREGRTAQIGTALQSGKREGMISLERCLADYVNAGSISLESAKAAANDLESLTMYLAK